jgi:hypothetical protein
MGGSRSIFVIVLAIAGLVLLWAVLTGRAASVWAALSGGAPATAANATGATSGGGAVNATVANTSAQLTPPTLVALPAASNATLPIASSPTQNYSINTLPSLQSLGLSLPGGTSAATTANATNSTSLATVNALPLFTSTYAASQSSPVSTGFLSGLFGGSGISSYTDLTPQIVTTSSAGPSADSLVDPGPINTSFVTATAPSGATLDTWSPAL